jgi:peptide/nickel transport system ATP-binding protein
MTGEPIVQVRDVHRRYRLPRRTLGGPREEVHALRGVSLEVMKGRSLGIVGESGCGKSTLARLILGLDTPTSGQVKVFGVDAIRFSTREYRHWRRRIQIVFQDPFGSLDPRMRVGRIVAEPLDALERPSRAERQRRIDESLEAVGLNSADAGRFPHEFSGGQRQRIAIARALITRPELVVADEPVSALDVSVQAQVLNLMLDLRDEFGLTYILVSHDLAVVEYVCEDLVVMLGGNIVERGKAEDVLAKPEHEYTRTLLSAVPALPPTLVESS